MASEQYKSPILDIPRKANVLEKKLAQKLREYEKLPLMQFFSTENINLFTSFEKNLTNLVFREYDKIHWTSFSRHVVNEDFPAFFWNELSQYAVNEDFSTLLKRYGQIRGIAMFCNKVYTQYSLFSPYDFKNDDNTFGGNFSIDDFDGLACEFDDEMLEKTFQNVSVFNAALKAMMCKILQKRQTTLEDISQYCDIITQNSEQCS